MFLSKLDLLKDIGLFAKVKSWAGHLNLEVKKPNPPTFKVNGPHSLPTRSWSSKGSYSRNDSHAFEGGEEFRLERIVIEHLLDKDGWQVMAMFVPANPMLTIEVASMALNFDIAMQCMEGFEDWSKVAMIEPDRVTAEKNRVKAETAHIPSVEETRASETWGAW